MIDTPITRADGRSTAADGIAALRRDPIESADVLGNLKYAGGQYSFRYRKMGGMQTKENWDPRNYEDDRSTGNVGSALRSHDINSLDHNVIYAIQLKYDLQSSPNITRVYSARDLYVWPAPPSEPKRRKAVSPVQCWQHTSSSDAGLTQHWTTSYARTHSSRSWTRKNGQI